MDFTWLNPINSLKYGALKALCHIQSGTALVSVQPILSSSLPKAIQLGEHFYDGISHHEKRSTSAITATLLKKEKKEYPAGFETMTS